jgi:hypothetical protein
MVTDIIYRTVTAVIVYNIYIAIYTGQGGIDAFDAFG